MAKDRHVLLESLLEDVVVVSQVRMASREVQKSMNSRKLKGFIKKMGKQYYAHPAATPYIRDLLKDRGYDLI